MIYPFQCIHKDEFIKLGSSEYSAAEWNVFIHITAHAIAIPAEKSVAPDMRDKFNEDVQHAESRSSQSSSLLHVSHKASNSSNSSSISAVGPMGQAVPRPDSLIKALLSSNGGSASSNSSTISGSVSISNGKNISSPIRRGRGIRDKGCQATMPSILQVSCVRTPHLE